MAPRDDPNRPEWRGKTKRKNFARINAACKGLKVSDGKPPADCLKCGTSHKFSKCPICGCGRRMSKQTRHARHTSAAPH